MKNFLVYSALILTLALGTSARAHAGSRGGDHGGVCNNTPAGQNPSCNTVAPEVDPSMAVAGLSLLGGALAVVRSRRRKQ